MANPTVTSMDFRCAEKEYRKALLDNELVVNKNPPMVLSEECPAELPAHRKTNIVLLPGFNSADHEWAIFIHALKPWCYNVLRAQVDVKLANEVLADNLFQWLKATGLLCAIPITLIGFSNGGLICRALLHKYGVMNIKKLIMIATPNWGTPLALFGKIFSNHPGLEDLKVGSNFLNWLNKGYNAACTVPHYVVVGDAAHDIHGEHYDAVVWESSATLGYTLPYIRVESGEAVRLYQPNSAWHLNLTRKSWRSFGPANDRVWPITLNYVRCLLARE